VMAAVKGDEIVPVDLAEACRAARGLPRTATETLPGTSPDPRSAPFEHHMGTFGPGRGCV